MGGLAGAAGAHRLSVVAIEPRWLIGGDATLLVAPDGPTVWLVNLNDPLARDRADALTSLPDEAASVVHHRDAGDRLRRRHLARLLLAAAAGCRDDAVVVERDEAGAPIVAAPHGWHLSVAARWPLCLVGIAPVPIGVDVELTGQPLPPDLLTETEASQLGALAGEAQRQATARCWALKEAHAKWTGRPLALDPATVDTAEPTLVTSPLGTTRCWWRGGADHVAAVCTA